MGDAMTKLEKLFDLPFTMVLVVPRRYKKSIVWVGEEQMAVSSSSQMLNFLTVRFCVICLHHRLQRIIHLAANEGLEDIVYALKHFADNYKVSYGDIIQFAGALALSNCPGSPRLAFWAGRSDAIGPSPPNLVPSPTDWVGKILARMADAGFTAEDTVALMAAHSIGAQKTIDPSIPNTPFDSTPGIFDSQFYLETLLKGTAYPGKGRSPAESKSPFKHEFRLKSDGTLARDARTACIWQSFVGNIDLLQ